MGKRECLLSVAMIVKDEEHNIRRALDSIKNVVDEIVVVDTGSKDRTPEIVREYTDKLYFHEWKDDFSEARNYSLKFPTCKWVMIFDADEEVSEEFKKNIRDFLKSLSDDVNTIYAPAVSYLDWDFKRKEVATIPRIFKNGTVYYKNIIHNQPVYKPKIARCPYPIYHYGYIWTRKLKEKKYNRTRNLIVKFLKEIKDPVEKVYYLIQLYKTEGIAGYDHRKFDAAWKALSILKKLKAVPTIAMEFMFLFGMECLKADILDLAEELFRSAINAQNDFPDPYYAMMALYEKKEDWERVIEWGNKFFEVFDRASKKLEEFSWTIVSMKYLAAANAIVSKAYFKTGNYKKALEHIKKSYELSKETGEDLKQIFKYYLVDILNIDNKEKFEKAKEIAEFIIQSSLKDGISLEYIPPLLEKYLEYQISVSIEILDNIKPNNKYEECLLKRLKEKRECFREILLSDETAVNLVLKYGAGALLVLYDIMGDSERLSFLNELRKNVENNKIKGIVLALMGDQYLKSEKFKESLSLYKKSIELLPELSHVVKPIIEDLKTRLTSDTDGVYEELVKDYGKKSELLWDVSKHLGRDIASKLYLISDHPLAKYTSAILQSSKQKMRKILEDLDKYKEKFPFYYFRLAKTYEEEDKEKAFNLHIKACENNYNLADIAVGKYSFTGLYPNSTLPFMKKNDEFLWAGNISERFSTLGIIHPVRGWKKAKDGFIYSYPFPSDEALKIYKERERKFYKTPPFALKDEYIINSLADANWFEERVKIYPEDLSEKYEWIFNDFGVKQDGSSKKGIILDGLEENYNLNDLIGGLEEAIIFYRVPNLKDRNDPVWYYPRFRILRTTYKIKEELEKIGYEIIDIKAFDKNLRAVHIRKLKRK